MSLIQQTFNFQDRQLDCLVVIITNSSGNSEYWFKGKDVALFLEYSFPKKAIQDNVKSCDKKQLKDLISMAKGLPQINQHPQTIFISEAGMYSLILQSKMPMAEKVFDWVIREVLPSIRRYGSYDIAQRSTSQESIDALVKMLENKDQQLQESNQQLRESNQQLRESHQLVLASNERNNQLCEKMLEMLPKQAVMTEAVDTQHVLEIYRCGNTYKFIRAQQRQLQQSRRLIDLDKFTLVYYKNKIPNSMNILNKIKEELRNLGVHYTAKNNEINTNVNLELYVAKLLQ